MITKRLFPIFGALLLACALMVPAQSQVPSSQPPYNIDTGALITNTLRVAGTVNSATQTNLDHVGVVCTLSQTASSGSPSVTFAIQAFDAATALWNTLVISSAVTAISATQANTIWVQPGLIAADVPTSGVGKSTHLPRTWRVQQVIIPVSGTLGPGTTGAIGCNLFR